MFKKNLFIIVLLLIISNSCIKPEEDLNPDLTTNWNPDFSAPIGAYTIGLNEVMDLVNGNEYLSINDGFISVVFSSDLDTLKVSDLFGDISLPINFGKKNIYIDKEEIEDSLYQIFPLSDETMTFDSIYLNSGELSYNYSIAYSYAGMIIISFVNIKNAKQIIIDTINFNGPLNGTKTHKLDSDAKIDLTDPYGGENQFKVKYKIIADIPKNYNGEKSIIIDNVTLGISDYSVIFGYLGQVNLPSISFNKDIPTFPFPDNFNPDTIYFANPTLSIKISNSIGVPFGYKFNPFEFSSLSSGLNTDLTESGILFDTVDFVYPPAQNYGQLEKEIIVLDNETTNGSISRAFNSFPDNLSVGVGAFINRRGYKNTDGELIKNSITPDAQFSMGFEFELPFWLALDVTLDTLIVSPLKDYEDSIDFIEQIDMRLNVDNFFPTAISLDLLFTNSTLTSQVSKTVSFAAGIVSDGVAIKPNQSQETITLTNEELNNLIGNEYIRFTATIQTPEQGGLSVKFRTNNTITIKLSTRAILLIKNP